MEIILEDVEMMMILILMKRLERGGLLMVLIDGWIDCLKMILRI
tara:strand:+ start:146 stop:277 length:132 start_codon:yes stop_codon:yes gene_type:complete